MLCKKNQESVLTFVRLKIAIEMVNVCSKNIQNSSQLKLLQTCLDNNPYFFLAAVYISPKGGKRSKENC